MRDGRLLRFAEADTDLISEVVSASVLNTAVARKGLAVLNKTCNLIAPRIPPGQAMGNGQSAMGSRPWALDIEQWALCKWTKMGEVAPKTAKLSPIRFD